MTFKEYYADLKTCASQKRLRNAIFDLAEVHEQTFYSWINRDSIPQPKTRKIISELIGKPEEELWPGCNE